MIREYRESDVDDVLRVWFEASMIAHPFLSGEFLDDERKTIRDVYLATARSWVYEVEGQVVGFIAMVENEIGGLFVAPDSQRGGVGRALVNTVSDMHSALEVEVFKENTIGCSFYKKYGFRPINESVHAETGRPILRLRYVG